MSRNLQLILVLLLTGSLHASAQWDRFRGPNGNGRSDAVMPLALSDADYAWKITLPDEGHGSPVVWNDRVYVTSGHPKTAEQTLSCIAVKDGATLWAKKLTSEPHHLHKFNHYGTTTPAVDEERVYTYWASDNHVILAAFSHEGEPVWQIDIGAFKSSHGGGTSPMRYKDLLVITNDQVGESFLLAVDRKTGKQRWKIPRNTTDNGTAYAVPCVYEEAGQKPQLIFTSRANGMTGVDPEAGTVLWEVPDLFPLRVVFSPVIAGELVISGCGQGGGGKRLVAIRPGSADGKRKPELVYEKKKALPYVPCPVVHEGLLFTLNDSTGVATCYEAATGQVHWQERLEGQQFFGSPVCVNGIIYTISKAGDLVAFRAAKSFEVLGTHALGELSYATPAVADGRMYLRSLTRLVSVRGK